MKNALMCGVAFNHHDSSVAFGKGNEVLLVLEAERIFQRKKMRCSPNEMSQLVAQGLASLGAGPDDVACWALATLENPWLAERDRVLRPPSWRQLEILGKRRQCLIVNHHLCHAASFLYGPFSRALVVTCDGGGDFGERISVYEGCGTRLTKLEHDTASFITAKPYDLCATYLYGLPRCEGRLMALAAYGEPQPAIVQWLEDAGTRLSTTDYEAGHRLLRARFPELEASATRFEPGARDFAASVQHWFASRRVADMECLLEAYCPEALVLAGGACLNLEANTMLWSRHKELPQFIPPCCDDTGQALGALVALMTTVSGTRPTVQLPYLGQGDRDVPLIEQTVDAVVAALLRDSIVLWHSGPAEIGPRALGNRSFLVRPDSLALKRILSETVKQRESYRPVAPVIPSSEVEKYFCGPRNSPYMLYQYEVLSAKQEPLAGCLHRDGTARVQTLPDTANPLLCDVLWRVGAHTGVPVLLNTSLNLQGAPLANAPADTREIARHVRHRHLTVIDGRLDDE